MEHAHIYVIHDAHGRLVKRVGADTYHAARKLAEGWVATLTRETGMAHTMRKIRNTRNSGVGY